LGLPLLFGVLFLPVPGALADRSAIPCAPVKKCKIMVTDPDPGPPLDPRPRDGGKLMGYSRIEVLTVAGLLVLVGLGFWLVVPQAVTRLFPQPAGAELVMELDPASAAATTAAPTAVSTANTPPEQTAAPDGAEKGAAAEAPEAAASSPAGGASADVQLRPGAVAAAGAAKEIYVHVAGAVAQPGVVQVRPGSRLFQVLELVGGLRAEAAIDFINLASPVQDGQFIYIPTLAELRSGRTAAGLPLSQLTACLPRAAEGVQGVPGAQAARRGTRINVNTATLDELVSVPGIGDTLARRIITYREQVGRFRRLEDLLAVTGIGNQTLQELRNYLRVE